MCMYAVMELHYTPEQFVSLPTNQKAFVIASIQLKMEEEKRRNRKK